MDSHTKATFPDIVERLRDGSAYAHTEGSWLLDATEARANLREAADEIERLREKLDKIRKALDAEPFKSSYDSDCCRRAYGAGEDDFAGVIASIFND